jgi:predicted DNA-binding protein
MEVHVAPELEKKLTDLAATTGRATEDLVQDVLTAYFEEVTRVRDELDTRYDDLKSGRVQPIDGDKALGRFRARSEAQRSGPR